jgi:exonuclease III
MMLLRSVMLLVRSAFVWDCVSLCLCSLCVSWSRGQSVMIVYVALPGEAVNVLQTWICVLVPNGAVNVALLYELCNVWGKRSPHPSVVLTFHGSANQGYKFLSWNIRGLNSDAKKEDVRQTISLFNLDLICVQETKLAQVDVALVRRCFGGIYEDNFVFLPATGYRGGILLAANSTILKITNPSSSNNTISATVVDHRSNLTWTVTRVSGPQGALEKKMFIRELRNLKQTAKPQWLILGDFNLIYREQDKNQGRLNRRIMTSFRRALNYLEVRELNLLGRKYTWSNH